jgi:hypothetical protein
MISGNHPKGACAQGIIRAHHVAYPIELQQPPGAQVLPDSQLLKSRLYFMVVYYVTSLCSFISAISFSIPGAACAASFLLCC